MNSVKTPVIKLRKKKSFHLNQKNIAFQCLENGRQSGE